MIDGESAMLKVLIVFLRTVYGVVRLSLTLTIETVLISRAVSHHTYLAVCAVRATSYTSLHRQLTSSQGLLTVANFCACLPWLLLSSLTSVQLSISVSFHSTEI